MSRREAISEQNSGPPEPPAVSPALRRQLQQCYEHGTKLFGQEKYDHDYAHSILVACIIKDPGNLVYLEAVLQNLERKYKHNKRGARLRGIVGRGPFKKAVAREEWANVLQLGPELLKTNPWNVVALRGLAQAFASYGYHEVELRYLKNALQANPKNVDVNRHCAQSLARIGQFDQAIACWQRVDEIRRGDTEAQEMISELQIEKAQWRGEQGGEEGRPATMARPEARARPPAAGSTTAADAPRRREVQLTPRQELEQQIANSPANLEPYLELSQLHIDQDRLGDAIHVLHKAQAASGNDLKIQERLEDVEVMRKKRQLAIAEKRAAKDASPENQELAQQLQADLNRFEWEIYYARADRYPGDLETQYQLGVRLKRLERYGEAVACFDAARLSEERRADSSLELGECWQHLRKYGKALEWYGRAADFAAANQAELRKLALYRAGVLAAGLHNLQAAEEHLVDLLELDPDYKDVATRLDKVREMRHNG